MVSMSTEIACPRRGADTSTNFTENKEEQPKMPGKGRPFQKGVSGNPGGRPKVLGDVQELARQKSPEAIKLSSRS